MFSCVSMIAFMNVPMNVPMIVSMIVFKIVSMIVSMIVPMIVSMIVPMIVSMIVSKILIVTKLLFQIKPPFGGKFFCTTAGVPHPLSGLSSKGFCILRTKKKIRYDLWGIHQIF